MGERGAFVSCEEVTGHFAPFPVKPVASVAAGDAFAGAFATCFAEGLSIGVAMPRAMAAGALAVTRQGAQESMPFRKEVEALVAAHPKLSLPSGARSR